MTAEHACSHTYTHVHSYKQSSDGARQPQKAKLKHQKKNKGIKTLNIKQR